MMAIMIIVMLMIMDSNNCDFLFSPKILRMDYWHTLKAVFTNRAFVVSECLPCISYANWKFVFSFCALTNFS